MKFISNTPKNADIRNIVAMYNETPEEALKEHKRWLSSKIIGEPQATSTKTVEELKRMGLVGVYLREDTET